MQTKIVHYGLKENSKKEMKNSKTPQSSFFILIENRNNSKAIPKSSSIKLTQANGFVTSSLHFKQW
jgi:hypothetical protein